MNTIKKKKLQNALTQRTLSGINKVTSLQKYRKYQVSSKYNNLNPLSNFHKHKAKADKMDGKIAKNFQSYKYLINILKVSYYATFTAFSKNNQCLQPIN